MTRLLPSSENSSVNDALENESGGVETVSNVNLLIKVIVSL